MCFHPVRCIFCSCLCASVGLVFEILSRSCLSFFFCSKTERPPSLSLFPGGDGMVRGGPGGARMVSADVWHSSDLSRPVYDPGYQVWQIWLRPLKRQGRSHDNHHSLSHAHLCLLVSRSGSWVVSLMDTSRPPMSMILVWPSLLPYPVTSLSYFSYLKWTDVF